MAGRNYYGNGFNGYNNGFGYGNGYYSPYGSYGYNTYPQQQSFNGQMQPQQQMSPQNAPQQAYYQNPTPNPIPMGMAYVNGTEGAKAFILPPNSSALLMDSDNPMFYIKTANPQGQCSLEYYKFQKVEPQQGANPMVESEPNYRAELDKIKLDLEELKRGLKDNDEL